MFNHIFILMISNAVHGFVTKQDSTYQRCKSPFRFWLTGIKLVNPDSIPEHGRHPTYKPHSYKWRKGLALSILDIV